jgi:hypothetical protein
LCVEREWAFDDFRELMDFNKKVVDYLSKNLVVDRNADIISENMKRLSSSINAVLNLMSGSHPKEEFIKHLEQAQRFRQDIDDAIQREPLEGNEINKV